MPPGPGPKPPEPQPPTPTDPLVRKFQEAFDAELVAKEKKADALKDKIELYRQAAELCTTRVAPTPGPASTRGLHSEHERLVRRTQALGRLVPVS